MQKPPPGFASGGGDDAAAPSGFASSSSSTQAELAPSSWQTRQDEAHSEHMLNRGRELQRPPGLGAPASAASGPRDISNTLEKQHGDGQHDQPGMLPGFSYSLLGLAGGGAGRKEKAYSESPSLLELEENNKELELELESMLAEQMASSLGSCFEV